ncbi:TetR family transcriptional regulator [Nonomuraea phyllanthi]|uniref:TetR/AcrR family transcriptional regulator n=1 Tax=Nonomuraea phyllanthi TaxID=2219224 RepID=UPI001293A277|nr:TetR/AcrR family transcriptional regulator [Nonomuraea phyllanthi]QFY13180.1 TetR family transcriptional regulator [Nonomuraea phyllanthi]
MTRAFVRARRPEHKQQRREAILAAARDLAVSSGVRNVSLGAVAEAAGLAKSNIMRYFGTREEIYLDLAAEEWRQWGAAVHDRLDASDDVVTALAETLEDRPLFCDLLGQTTTTLEHNVSVPAARTFKRACLAVTADLGRRVARIAGLTDREGVELVAAAGVMAGVLYPISRPGPALAELYAQDPDIAAACPDFHADLVRTLRALLAGLPAIRES